MKTDQHVSVTRGDSERVVIPIADGDTDGWISDLSTMVIRYEITTGDGSGTAVISKTDSDAAITIEKAGDINSTALDDTGVPDTADVIVVDLAGSETTTFDEYRYYHECELEDPNGIVKTVLKGQVAVESSAT